MNQHKSSFILGCITIVLWSSLAALGKLLIHLPPFYLLGWAFLLGSVFSWRKPKEMFPSWKISVWGILGFFFYHFFLFYALRFAPAIEANLINYMWPVLLVMMTPIFFKDQKLAWYHFAGSTLAVIGCVLLVGGEGFELKEDHLKGYLLAAAAALAWPIYSLGKKKLGETSVWAIGGFCLGSSVLCFMTHAWIEPVTPLPPPQDLWLILIMGLGPFGIAFYTWDLAIHRGDTRVIGALTYLDPVLSTLGLILFAGQVLGSTTLVAMLLIVVGSCSGLVDFFKSKN